MESDHLFCSLIYQRSAGGVLCRLWRARVVVVVFFSLGFCSLTIFTSSARTDTFSSASNCLWNSTRTFQTLVDSESSSSFQPPLGGRDSVVVMVIETK